MSIAANVGKTHGKLAPALARQRVAQQMDAVRAAPLDVAVVTCREAFEALEPEWGDLLERAAKPWQAFQSFHWHWHWCNHYLDAKRHRLAIVTGRAGNRLVMLWPMIVEQRLGFRTAMLMGAPMSQYGDVLLDPAAGDIVDLLTTGWQTVVRDIGADLVLLRKVRVDSFLAQLLNQLRSTPIALHEAPYLDLSSAPDFSTYEQRYPGKDRKNRRRQRKRLSEIGDVGFRRLRGAQATAESLARAMEHKRRWLHERGLASVAFANDTPEAFFRDAVASLRHPVGCCIAELTLRDAPVAVAISLVRGRHQAVHITAYDSAYEKCAPGALLFEDMISAAKGDGIDTFDLLAPTFPYKMTWADGVVAVNDWALPIGLKGRLLHGVYITGLRPRLQWLMNEGPQPVRKVMHWLLCRLHRA